MMTKKQIEEVIEDIFGSWDDTSNTFDDYVVNELYKRYGTKPTQENQLYVPANQLTLFPPEVSKTADEMLEVMGYRKVDHYEYDFLYENPELTVEYFAGDNDEKEICFPGCCGSETFLSADQIKAIYTLCCEQGWFDE